MKERDLKIVNLIAEGKTAKEIGAALDLSNRTVEKLIEDIKYKYGAKDKANLVAILFKWGVLK